MCATPASQTKQSGCISNFIYCQVAVASTSVPMDKGLEELEKEITCPVCHDHFQEPKILPCCHYYCKKCIHALARAAGGSKPFPCPECRRDTLLPQNDLDQLPTAFFVNRMKELYTKMAKTSGRIEAVCEMCSGGPAAAFCHQCTYFICLECVKSHQKMKVFAKHNVTTLDELKEGGAKQMHILTKHSPPPYCSLHDKKMKLYCFDCNCLICRDCIIFDHAGHKSDFIKKTAPQTKETLTTLITPLKNTNTKLCQAIDDINSSHDEIVAQQTLIANEIDQSFQKLYEVLDRRKQELLSEVESIGKQKLERLSTQEKTLSTSSITIKSVTDLVEQICTNSTDEELMSTQQQLVGRINEVVSNLPSEESSDLEPAEEADMKLKVDCSHILYELCLANATVSVGVKDYTIKFEHPGSDNVDEVKKTSKLSIEICGWLPNGKPAKKFDVQMIAAELTSKVDGSVTGITTHLNNHVCELDYVPLVRGQHELTISINNKQVKGGPFPVFVAVSPTQLGKPIRTITGLANPWGIAFSSAGEMLVTEYNGDIVKIGNNGERVAFVKRSVCNFRSITGIAIDEDNSVYIAQCSAAGKLFKFDKNGQLLQTIIMKKLKQPRGLTISGKNLIVCGYDQIQVYTRELTLVKQFGSRGSYSGELKEARNVAIDDVGNFYVCDSHNDRIQVFNSLGEFQRIFCQILHPLDLFIFNNQIYISSETSQSSILSIFSTDGTFLSSFGNQGEFSQPFGIYVDCNGFIHICDFGNSRILVF